jgi:hypothetical protein
MTIKLYVYRDVMTRKLPRVEVEPIIWHFNLVAIDNLLFEDSISIAEAITPSGIIEGSHAVQETCGKASKTTVSERSVMLLANYVLHTETKLGKALLEYSSARVILSDWVVLTCGGVFLTNIEHGIVECSTHEKFEGQV